MPLGPTFLYRAEFSLCCHVSKLAEEGERSIASSCGLFLETRIQSLEASN